MKTSRTSSETKPAGESESRKIPVGISSCLLGEEVRYDGDHQRHSYIQSTLGRYLDFRPFCPEVAIGLGVPRRPIRLIADSQDDSALRCVDAEDVDIEWTSALRSCAREQESWQQELCGYILKKSSPSCGVASTRVYDRAGPDAAELRRDGSGIYAGELIGRFPELPVEEEGRIGEPALRASFIRRVWVYRRWKAMLASGLSLHALIDFHARHKLVIMSHSPGDFPRLGRKLAGQAGQSPDRSELEAIAAAYLRDLMEVLKAPAGRGRHINVLQYVQGYLRGKLSRGDLAELSANLDSYRAGRLPLQAVIALLNHHFRRHRGDHDVDYINRSWYMNPEPGEAQLLADQ